MVCYFLPLLSGAHKVYSTPEHSFWCCVGSGFESHAKYAESIYMHGDTELFVNLFIPSKLTWAEKGVTLRQETSFPEEETTVLTFEEADSHKLRLSLRYPWWSGKPTIKVNGKKVKTTSSPSSYISIDRKWNKGDKVEVTYPMSLRVETAPDNAYYTYDYHIPADLKTTLDIDPEHPGKSIRRTGAGLTFTTAENDTLVPLYEANRCRYVVYWDIK